MYVRQICQKYPIILMAGCHIPETYIYANKSTATIKKVLKDRHENFLCHFFWQLEAKNIWICKCGDEFLALEESISGLLWNKSGEVVCSKWWRFTMTKYVSENYATIK